MPAMANIVVKKADGTTNVTYAAQRASAGDNLPAEWRLDDAALPRSFRPRFQLVAGESGRDFRRVRTKLDFPVVRTINGVATVVGTPVGNADVRVFQGLTAAEINEFVEQYANLIRAALTVACMKDGYGPTGA